MKLLQSLAILVGASLSFASAASVFTFDTNTVGQNTGFTDTVGGLSATFSSPADNFGGGFVVVPASVNNFQSPMAGNVLEDPGGSGLDYLPLYITFSQPVMMVSFNFATDGVSPLVMTAYNGNTMVGQAQAVGTVPNGGFFPQGTISFSGMFNRIVIADAVVPYFAIDNVTASTVPEPTSLLLIGGGLIGLGGLSRLRRKRS